MNAEGPLLARWLLSRFGIEPALVGDFVEELGAGRSTFWFWRQTFNAIWTNIIRDLKTHPALAVRAVATGWLIELASWKLASLLQPPEGIPYPHPESWAIFLMLWTSLWPAIVAAIVARTHRSGNPAMVLVYIASLALEFTGEILIRPHLSPSNAIRMYCVIIICSLIGGLVLKPSTSS